MTVSSSSVSTIQSSRKESVAELQKKKSRDELQKENEELKAQVESLEGQLTDTQMALCDVYELLVPVDGEDA